MRYRFVMEYSNSFITLMFIKLTNTYTSYWDLLYLDGKYLEIHQADEEQENFALLVLQYRTAEQYVERKQKHNNIVYLSVITFNTFIFFLQ